MFNGYYRDEEMSERVYIWIEALEKENRTLLSAVVEAEKAHQGYHSELGWKLRDAMKMVGVPIRYSDKAERLIKE